MASREVEIGNGSLKLFENEAAVDGKCYTGSWIWDCALVLAHWLDKIAATGPVLDELPDLVVSKQLGLGEEGFRGKRVVELGAGTGLPGMVTALLGASEVVLTDRAELLPGLQRNVEANGLQSKVKVRELEWGTDCSELFSEAIDFVVCSDIMYDVESMPALAKTLVDLCGKQTRILVAYELRLGTTECFDVLRKYGLEWTWVPRDEQDPHWQSEDIGIFILKLTD